MKQKILIISRAIFPQMAPRAQRATELAKEFARQGHDVTLCAVLGKYDYTAFEKQYGIKVRNLGVSGFEWITSDVEKRKISLWRKAVVFLLRRLLLFPDCLVGLRVRKYLKKDKTPYDRIITIAIPYPIHFGTGYAFRHYPHLQQPVWISDCGDPFTGNPYSKHPFYFKNIERKWCKTTHYITVPIPEAKKAYLPECQEKIRVIPQGFDFSNVHLANYAKHDVPTFAYSGMVYPQRRDPSRFLEYLASIQQDFKFIVYTTHTELFDKYKDALGEKLEYRSYVPHDQLLSELSKMDFLLNIRNESAVQAPSKLIDYGYTRRPVLEITSAFNEKETVDEFLAGDYTHATVIPDIEQYDIKNVCQKFLELN